MSQYGFIDTAAYASGPAAKAAQSISEKALAVALAMPSVSHTGHPSKRGNLKNAGLTAAYLAYMLQATQADGCGTDSGFAAISDTTSNKQNNLSGLALYPGDGSFNVTHGDKGLIAKFGKSAKGQAVYITKAGVAWVKSVNPELGKVAADFTEAARAKAVREAKRAEREAGRVEAENSTGEAPEVFGDENLPLDVVEPSPFEVPA